MFAFNHDVFSQSYEPAFGTLKTPAVSGLEVLLGFIEQEPDVTGSTCLPPSNTNAGIAGSRLKEFGKGKGRPYGHAARVANADDTQFAILTMPVALCNRPGS
jgi:hypothetical protein